MLSCARLAPLPLPPSPKMSFPPSQANRFNQTDNRRIGTISLTRTGSVCVFLSLQGEREDKVFYSDSDVQTVKNAEYQWNSPCAHGFRGVTESTSALCNTDMVWDLCCTCACVCVCVFVSRLWLLYRGHSARVPPSSGRVHSSVPWHPSLKQSQPQTKDFPCHQWGRRSCMWRVKKKRVSGGTSQSEWSEVDPKLSRLVCEASLPDCLTADSWERPHEASLPVIHV